MSAALHSLSRTRASLAARVCLRCAHARTFASVPSSDWEGVPASSRPASPSTTAPGSGSVRHSVSQGAVQFVPRDVTPELVRRIGEREAELRANYDALPAACGDVASRAEALRKRLLYRSKQRGWLEVDLLMGAFAEAKLASLSEAELAQYERLLNRETLDIYNLITGKDAVPPELEGSVILAVKAFVAASPLGKADPGAYARSKGTYSN